MAIEHFFGPEAPPTPPASCRYAILPLPYDATASWIEGAAGGPEAIREASYQIEFHDEERGSEPWAAGITTLETPPIQGLPPAAMAERVEREAGAAMLEGRHLIGVGGEHGITPPLVAATRAALGEFDVLQIDAHADLREAYRGEARAHACTGARLRQMGHRLVQVGVRSCSARERDLMRATPESELRVFWMHELRGRGRADWIDEVIDALGPRVYVTFDLDALDPAIVPAVGTPEPGGLSWIDALELLAAVAARREAAGSDFVELCPQAGLHHADFLAARLIYKWIGLLERGGKKDA